MRYLTLFWIIVIAYHIWNIKKTYIRFNNSRKYLKYIIIISTINIITYLYMGVIFGFLKNPYSQKLTTMLENIFLKVIPIIGIELTRGIIATKNKKNKKILIFLTILLGLLEINYNTLSNIWADKELLFKYICSNVFPTIAYSILYTYLTLKGSYLIVLIYRIFKDLVIFLSPILPDIDWFVTGVINILNTVIIYILFKYVFIKKRRAERRRKKELSEKISYAITLILLIVLACFMLGVFKYEPISILSNSMTPTYNRGDIVIFKKISEKELKKIPENSIIIYKIGNLNIAHRVIEKIQEKNTVLYRTKGDNNNMADPNLVEPKQILGIYAFHIMYVGFPSVWLHDYFSNGFVP